MPATFEEAAALQAPYLNAIPLTQTNYKVNIDDPAGAEIRVTRDGMSIYMLYREPGVYWNDHARKVPEELAEAAGFKVAHWAKVRRRQLAMRDAMQGIEQEYAEISRTRVLAAHGEYRVTQIAPGYCNIEFVDDEAPEEQKYTILNARGPVSEEVALRRFQELSGHTPSAPADASQPADADVEKAPVKRAK